MQPYQQASEESTKQSYRPIEAAATLAAPALKAKIGGKIMSVINKYIPANFAMKGLSKIDPRLGKFASLAQEAGHSFDEIRNFVGNKVEEGEKIQESPKENRNIVEQYSPELHQYILGEIKKGKTPLEAGALAFQDRSGQKSFKAAIKKLEQDHKSPWSSIVEAAYGGQTSQQSQQPQGQPQQPIQSQAQGLDPQVMQILQQGNEIMKKFRGSP